MDTDGIPEKFTKMVVPDKDYKLLHPDIAKSINEIDNSVDFYDQAWKSDYLISSVKASAAEQIVQSWGIIIRCASQISRYIKDKDFDLTVSIETRRRGGKLLI